MCRKLTAVFPEPVPPLIRNASLASIMTVYLPCQQQTRRGLGRAILEAGRDAACAEDFQRLDLGATLPGVPLYLAYGFKEIEPFVVTMPDGVRIEAVAMERPID